MPMIFVAILICLALQRFGNISLPGNLTWFNSYLKLLDRWLNKVNEYVAIVLVIAPIWLLFFIIYIVLRKWHLYDIFTLCLATVVLFFTVDARDMGVKLKPYFTALGESDTQRAMEAVAYFIDTSFVGSVKELERAVSKTVLLRSFEDIFAGLFWFIVFGIYGISAYILVKLVNQSALKVNANYVNLANFAGKLQSIFEWLPSRLVGFSFALVGRFSKSASYCMNQLWSGPESVKRFIVESGLAALDLEPADYCGIEENHAALDIINRVIIIWLVAIFFVLIGIMI